MSDDALKNKFKALKEALSKEGAQTKVMFETYARFTTGKATQEEMENANKQFRDVLKTLGLGIFAVLPAAPITIPLILKIGKKLGIDILPDSFSSSDNETKEKEKGKEEKKVKK